MTSTPTEQPAARVVVLGASNVSLAWPQLTRTLLQRCSRPLHLHTAHGMGRSYLGLSRFGLRSMPGILESGIWDELSTCDGPPLQAALITDLGNDLVYGHSAEKVVRSAADAVARIRNINPGCQIVVTRPPVASVESLSVFRFGLFRTLLFPLSKLSLSAVINGARALDEGLSQLEGVTIATPQPEWYGFDPIHILGRFRESAFRSYLASWPAMPEEPPASSHSSVPRPTAGIRWICGRPVRRAQSSVNTPDISVSCW